MSLTNACKADTTSSSEDETSMQSDLMNTVATQQVSTPLTKTIDALENSPLGRVPGEIRNTIYTMALTYPGGLNCKSSTWRPMSDGTSPSQALNLRATCKQIRAETEGMFFALNDVSIWSDLNEFSSLLEPCSSLKLRAKQTVQLLNAIPSSMISPCSRLVVWISPSISGIGRDHFKPRMLKVTRDVQHFQVHVGTHYGAHHWTSSGYEQQAKLTSGPSDRIICAKDPAVSMNDCASFEFVFPVDDRAGASALLEDLIAEKVALLEAHKSHRFCPVRAEFEGLVKSFDVVREKLLEFAEDVHSGMIAEQ